MGVGSRAFGRMGYGSRRDSPISRIKQRDSLPAFRAARSSSVSARRDRLLATAAAAEEEEALRSFFLCSLRDVCASGGDVCGCCEPYAQAHAEDAHPFSIQHSPARPRKPRVGAQPAITGKQAHTSTQITHRPSSSSLSPRRSSLRRFFSFLRFFSFFFRLRRSDSLVEELVVLLLSSASSSSRERFLLFLLLPILWWVD